jgi:hypothetical protein
MQNDSGFALDLAWERTPELKGAEGRGETLALSRSADL